MDIERERPSENQMPLPETSPDGTGIGSLPGEPSIEESAGTLPNHPGPGRPAGDADRLETLRDLPPSTSWPPGPIAPPMQTIDAEMPPPERPRQDRQPGRILLPLVSGFVGAVIALAAVAGMGVLDLSSETTTTTATSTTVVDEATEASATPSTGSTLLQLRESNVDAVGVGEVVIPSIVSVEIVQETASGLRPLGSGSGVVFDTEGHIITNDHVVSGGPAYRVVFADGRVYEASLVGTDPVTDLAVLKIEADDLVPIELGSADELSVGDPTVAVGNPLGLDGGPSLTVGVLSATNRQVQTSASDILHGMLQTDAPITQGSSGGALVDELGRLVGITTAVGVSEIGVEGIGFATPVEIVERVVTELIADGEAGTAYLGIVGGTSFDTAADGALVPGGVEIGDVEVNGAAALAGLRVGDVIVSYEGVELDTMEDLIVLLRRSSVGDEVQVMVERDGAVESIDLTLGAR